MQHFLGAVNGLHPLLQVRSVRWTYHRIMRVVKSSVILIELFMEFRVVTSSVTLLVLPTDYIRCYSYAALLGRCQRIASVVTRSVGPLDLN